MKNNRKFKSIASVCFYSFIVYFILVAGCVSKDTPVSDTALINFSQYNGQNPLLSIFLHPDNDPGVELAFTLETVELFDGEQWVSAMENHFTYDSLDSANGQAFISRVILKKGTYSKIRLSVANAQLREETARFPLQTENETIIIDLPSPVRLGANDRYCLFLVLDKNGSVSSSKDIFTPVIRAYNQEVLLTSELAYISSPQINALYIVRTDSNRIIGSWSVTGKPTFLKAFKDDDVLYVLAENEKVIKVFELSSGRLTDVITIPLIIQPGKMEINSSRTNAYILDQRSDFVYRIDLATKSIAARKRIGDKLDYALYLEDNEQLVVSSKLSQKIYFLDPSTLEIQNTISSARNPDGLYDYSGSLYIAESSANSMMIYNYTTGAITRKNVGMEPIRIIENGGHLFVSNKRSGSVSIVLPNQLTTLKEVRNLGSPVEMAFSTNRRWLYALDVRGNMVQVIDLTSHKQLSNFGIHTTPFDIEIIN